MAQTKLTFEFSGEEPTTYTRTIPIENAMKSGFCSDMIEAFGGQVPEEGFTITVTNKIPPQFQERIVNTIVEILNFLNTPDGLDFIDNTRIISFDYNNEKIDAIISRDITHLAHMLGILNFMNINSVYRYICNIIGQHIKLKHYARLKTF